MAIPKIPSQVPPSISSSRKRRPSSPDYAKDLFWVALVLQGIYIVGTYKKIEFLQSNPIFFSLVLLPALIFVVAKTWKSAFKSSILCSLIVPATVIVLLLSVATLSLIKNSNGGEFLSKVKMSFSVGGTVWAVLLTAVGPAVVLGVLGRLSWNFFRRT